MNIQWYPGHMTKTRRMLAEQLKNVDMVCEIIDARIPISSRNPDLDELMGEKPHMLIFNRAGQADPVQNQAWIRHYQKNGLRVLKTDAKTGEGISKFPVEARSLMREKLERYAAKGQTGRTLRAMVAGIPNVGKSTFINRISGRKSAKAEDRPGVTRGRQWVSVDHGLEMLDTPGILWPKFEEEQVGLHLAFTGAVRDEIIDTETLSFRLIELLARFYPSALEARYHIQIQPGAKGHILLALAAQRRGFLVSGGEPDLERMARVLLDEFRGGKLGRFTLERPPEEKEGSHGRDKSLVD
ncbi:MAG: ribosome biogenesis GTPase YlqF [Oscillospiraceae bacterium]|nr:ribosome biogenesis GTPase YlqF [Oscillospiraceae bacterium]